ncbi:MAG: NupC/NupG family nucleoside CNT transporter [Pseudobdellovibrionaceae bacterium]|nr:hypothetical protein [Bdellovibrionales bacterium]USN48785.1 MAG: NupC/NupG family nucleoside CNT transporter [Pseudobdellovibrionaceae bacterium]
MRYVASLIGVVVLIGVAWLLSTDRKAVRGPVVFWGLGLQAVLALSVLGIPALEVPGVLRFVFDYANDGIMALLAFTDKGSQFVFGDLANSNKLGFIFAFQVLPTIIFVASFMSILYHLGFMQIIVHGIAYIMQRVLGTSGAESLSVAANIFVGQTEAPLVIRPYLEKLTRSELFAVMTGGMATVAGGVMAAYVGLLKDTIPDIAGHLLTASVMSAPAALAISKIMFPEKEIPETLGDVPKTPAENREHHNIIEAAASGAAEGLKLALNVAAMLLAFIALIAAVDALLGVIGGWTQFSNWGKDLVPKLLQTNSDPKLSLSLVLGWFFAPLAWVMGIPWEEAGLAGALLGEKIILNEFVAYLHLSQVMAHISERTTIILSYALCGFANFSSIAIQLGGIGALAPSRRRDLAELGIRSVIGGSLAAFLTATIAGLLI